MTIDRVGDRYRNDAAFHAAVDMLQGLMLDLHLSPSEIREAAMFAVYMVESRRMPGPYRIEPCGCGRTLCMNHAIEFQRAIEASESERDVPPEVTQK